MLSIFLAVLLSTAVDDLRIQTLTETVRENEKPNRVVTAVIENIGDRRVRSIAAMVCYYPRYGEPGEPCDEVYVLGDFAPHAARESKPIDGLRPRTITSLQLTRVVSVEEKQ